MIFFGSIYVEGENLVQDLDEFHIAIVPKWPISSFSLILVPIFSNVSRRNKPLLYAFDIKQSQLRVTNN